MTDKRRLYLSPPDVGAAERRQLLAAFDSNWIAPLGPDVDGFEAEFAAKVGVPHAAALSSGTAALHLALRLAGVGPGDEVWASTLTFVATINAITYVGATPVLFDSERRTWNLDPQLLRQELELAAKGGRLPKAIIVVDLYGHCADWPAIEEVCRDHGVFIVEDAAEALGASLGGRAAGSFGHLGVFSFNGNKIITTSGGGMLVGADQAMVDKARWLAAQAREPVAHYEHEELGYNYRMSNLLAALGRAQLAGLDEKVARRRAIHERYRTGLSGIEGIEFLEEVEAGSTNRWLTVMLIDASKAGADRDAVMRVLGDDDVEARPVWKPMHRQPLYANARCVGGEVADDLYRHGLCVPSGSSMSDEDVDRVIAGIRRAFGDRG